jgi:hypothetical protein
MVGNLPRNPSSTVTATATGGSPTSVKNYTATQTPLRPRLLWCGPRSAQETPSSKNGTLVTKSGEVQWPSPAVMKWDPAPPTMEKMALEKPRGGQRTTAMWTPSLYSPRPRWGDVVYARETRGSSAHSVRVVDADRNRNSEEGGRDRDDR